MPYPTKKLGEICNIITGNTPKTKYKEYYGGAILWAGPSDFGNFKTISDTKKTLTKKGLEEGKARIVKKGSVLLVAIGATIGKVGIAGTKITTNQQINSFECNDNINGDFLYYFFRSIKKYFLKKSSQTTLPILNKTQCKDIKIPLPPLPTQKLIVKKLDSAFKNIDESIKITKKNIENIEELNKSILGRIFEEGDYNKVELSKITTLLGGGTPKTNISEYWGDDVIWLSPTDLPKIGEIVNVSNSLKKISKLGLEKSSAKLLPIGTVIYSSRATIGKIAINTTEVATNQGFANFVCNDNIYNYYLAYTLKYYTDDILSLSNSTTFKEVNKTNLRSYKIPIPSLQKQKQIVSYLDKVFEKNKDIKKGYENKLKDLEEMKQSILKEAFEGRLVEG